MGRIDQAFAVRKSAGNKVLVAYLCVGDPDEKESVELACAAADAGADVLELGCPFSDPTADGPAIARASQRALAKGGGLASTLRVARAVRDRHEVPIVLFGYYNPLFVKGEAAAADAAADAGVDAFLVVDLPLDESHGLRTACARRNVGVVPLLAPTSTDARVASVRDMAARFPVPFVYYVSMTGVTGGAGAASVLSAAGARAAAIRDATALPTVVGFGIDSSERAKLVAGPADGVVVGSALVRRIEEGKSPDARVSGVRDILRDLRAVL